VSAPAASAAATALAAPTAPVARAAALLSAQAANTDAPVETRSTGMFARGGRFGALTYYDFRLAFFG
jgi:hypothetical protein